MSGSGQPGDGCTDQREIHPHWCGFCGAEELFGKEQCADFIFIPPCPRCMRTRWRNEIDMLTAPDYREKRG